MKSFWGRAAFTARIGLLSASFASSVGSATIRDRIDRYGMDGWAVTLRHDAFTGQLECNMHSDDGRMLYQPSAVGFRFRHSRRDTLDAWYRLEDGPAQRWRDRFPTLIAAGVAIDGPGLDDPTDGIVWLPEADVSAVNEVTIRPTRKARPQTFHLGDFAALANAVRRLGCWPRS